MLIYSPGISKVKREILKEVESSMCLLVGLKRGMMVGGEGKDVISINPEVFGEMISFRKDPGTTGQPLPQRASISFSGIF